jgi:type IV pilus assembly protein PilB
MMELNSQIRDLAFSRASTSDLRKAARAGGMRTLLDDGRVKVFRGVTTPEEISRVTQAEGLVMD